MSTYRLPFRWRLTASYGILVALSFLVIGLGLYLGLQRLLHENFEEQLQKQSDLALANIDLSGPHPKLDPVMLATLQDDEHFVRILTSDGTLTLDTGPTVGAEALDAQSIASVLSGRVLKLTVSANEEDFTAILAPISSGNNIVGALQIGFSRGDVDETLRLISIVLGIAVPVVLVIAIAGGYLVAGRAIAPVSTIADLAADLDGSDLHARLNLDLPNDELGRLARTFDGMLERIEQTFDRQRRFTGDAAHELRTPITMMRGEVDLALRSPKTAEQYRASLEHIDGDLQRMTGLVASLLTLARADDHQFAIATRSFDLDETIQSVIDVYRPIAETNGLSFHTDTSQLMLNGDEDLIIQLLVNLVENAIAHTPRHGVITIGASRTERQTILWVEDTGSGIEAKHLDRIFDRFYRVDEGRSRERGGSGLGLSICRAIVELHHGKIVATSTPGVVTRMTITFTEN